MHVQKLKAKTTSINTEINLQIDSPALALDTIGKSSRHDDGENSEEEALIELERFSGYNQIQMAPEDKGKTTFIITWGTFCYKVMPFKLKNARATYQRAMITLFHDMMHKEVEVYVDAMIAKSKTPDQHVEDLHKLFVRLRKYQLRLNLAKCTFGVKTKKLLGFIVNERGINLDLDKVKAIRNMPPPRIETEALHDYVLERFDLASSPTWLLFNLLTMSIFTKLKGHKPHHHVPMDIKTTQDLLNFELPIYIDFGFAIPQEWRNFAFTHVQLIPPLLFSSSPLLSYKRIEIRHKLHGEPDENKAF
ncbi:Retrovirus-related Pol polyprotein from transposon 17.6, partial [Mucuna pruriens]